MTPELPHPLWPAGPWPPRPPRPGEVHVWCADLDTAGLDWRGLVSLLDAGEQEHTARIRVERDRRRATVCRATLRLLLGAYLGADPRTIRFAYGPYGKPALERPDEPPLHFNVSHCEGLALLAVSTGAEVGIDIERVRPRKNLDAIAEYTFSPAEYAALRRVSPSERTRAFFRCWTRKEAFVKARGGSITVAGRDFDVSLDRRAAILRMRPDPREAHEWSLRELALAEGWVGALAVRGEAEEIRCWSILPGTGRGASRRHGRCDSHGGGRGLGATA